jgi:DNA-directed RNA polymerase
MLNFNTVLDAIIPHLPIARKSSVEKYAAMIINLSIEISAKSRKRFKKPRLACHIALSHEVPDIRLAVLLLAELERIGMLETRRRKQGIKTIAEAYPTEKLMQLLIKAEPAPNVRRYPIPTSQTQAEFEVRRGIKLSRQIDGVQAVAETPFVINDFSYWLMEAFPPFEEDDPQYLQYHVAFNEAGRYLHKKFKFPYFFCSRGRMYDDATVGFSTQGADHEKALVIPCHKEALTESGFKALLEAAEGYSELELSIDETLEIARDPVRYKDVWSKADKPYSFMACADFINTYINDKSIPLSSFIPLDGRCSGLQHWSALLGTSAITARLGMESAPADDGLDMYEFVAHVWASKLEEAFKEFATRKSCKITVMTFAYSATRMSSMDKIHELFGAKSEWSSELDKYVMLDDGGLSRSQTAKLGSQLFDVTNEILQPIVVGVDWMKSCAKMILEHTNHPRIQWRTPDGFEASQYTIKWNRLDIRVRDSRRKQHKVSIRVPQMGKTGEPIPSVKKAQSGIGPNIIHSLDATHLRMVAHELQKRGIVGVWIHDSFAVHVNYRDVLYDIIIEKFIELYDRNYLLELKEYWEYLYKLKLPEPPTMGDWDVNTLRNCKEFFA